MKKRNALMLVLVGASAVLATSTFAASKGALLRAIHPSNLTYGHYEAVLPGFETPGSKEYWVCCETHEVRFEKPLEGVIFSQGAPTQEEIASFEAFHDGRYVAPIVKTDAKHFQYGVYPQDRVSDASLLTALNGLSDRGSSGYFEYDGKYYEKCQANPYINSYQFDDGETISYGTTYWFECAPIEWKILSSENDEYFVISEKLLDVTPFNADAIDFGERTDYEGNTAEVYDNNYKYSDIRTFLNVDFLGKAFFNNRLNLKKTAVDNSVATAYGKTNPYVCEDTEDAVFLLSYADIRNPSYFSVIENRCSVTTDFARARGAFLTEDTKHPNCANYFSRSPGTEFCYSVMEVDGSGEVDQHSSDDDDACIRPAMKLTIPTL